MAHCLLCPLQCVKDVAKCIFTEALWPPVKRHIDYWWCFDGNVQGLRDQITNLEREMSNMNQKIEQARLDGKIPTTDVQNLSNEGTQKLEEAKRISRSCDDLKVWKICPRYSKGKSAKETAEGIAKLRNEGNSIRIADPAPPAAMVPITHAPTLEFQSRKSIEEDIIKSLKDGNMIAICGLGGVGKTTMAERIVDWGREYKVFDEVVFVVVSQPIDKLKIQKQIAEILGLGLSEETLEGRAHKLRTRLMDSKKKLVIFDDVWESFELKDIGVPFDDDANRTCKIILTSRNTDVCGEMGANEVIEIEVLDEEEAWTLFREKSGLPIRIEDLYFRRTAEEVAAECKGLPIALATVGKALKNKRKKTWEDALFQLRGANPTNFPQVLKHVYKPLKLSYDFLETESEKSLFLLCCLFPEDYNIKIEDLTLLSFGLGMFDGIHNIEDGRNRTYHSLDRLRSCYLLMNGGNEDEVKMHDVVRDVAIFIGSKEKKGFLNVDLSSKDSSRNCNWMSVADAKLPIGLDFPNLCLLMILNSSYEYPEGFDVKDIGFKGMEELTVLYFSNQNIPSLSSSLKFLKKLRKLHLHVCTVEDISVVGELASLEILRIWRCHYIEELPSDVGNLKFLRLLELRDCRKLKRIVVGVISSLVGLEELKIVDCFDKWEAKGNASLSEIESLRNLTSLEIDIFDPNFVVQDILLSKHLRRYQIRSYIHGEYLNDGMKHEKTITLYLPRDVTVGNWIRPLVNNTESLALDGDGSNNFNLGEIESLRTLVFNNCSTVEKLVNAVDCKFPMLEHLKLRKLKELEEIIDGTIPEGSNSFQNLKSLYVRDLPKLRYLWNSPNQNVNLLNLNSIYISDCPNLRSLFSIATARSLVQLQSLEIYLCETMEQVLWNETESNTEASIIEFPKLKKLKLFYLPNLLAFTQGVESIKFPKLKRLTIGNLARLNSFVATESEPTHDNNSLHFFCNKKVEMIGMKELYLCDLPNKISNIWCRHIPINFFHNLEGLNIYKVEGITNLISSSIAKALVNLNRLSIQICERMVDVIEDETLVPVNLIFPNLKYLVITGNYKLRSFCQWKHAFELPSLEEVKISFCPLMKTFTLGSLSTPKLHQFRMNFKDIEIKDLNGGIHHFTSTEITNKDENNEDENGEDEYSDEDQKEIEGEEKTESSNNVNLM